MVDGYSTQFSLYVRPKGGIINLNAGSSGYGVDQDLQAGWLVIAAKVDNKRLRQPHFSARITVNGVYPGKWMRIEAGVEPARTSPERRSYGADGGGRGTFIVHTN